MEKCKNIWFKGYKAFSNNEYVCVRNTSRVNVVIGKNNSGKSSLLDIVELVYNNNAPIRAGFEVESVCFDTSFDRETITAAFSGLSRIGRWTPSNLFDFVNSKRFVMEIKGRSSVNFKERTVFQDLGGHESSITNTIENKKRDYRFRRISAERNITPEAESAINLYDDGEGATNLIRHFINNSKYDEKIIEEKLLNALNKIMMPDAEYESIKVQQVESSGKTYWEVFLQEKGMQRIPLSKTGSGLKTIVLVLLNLLVIPETEEYKGFKIVYGFEELENNLHPALQRRLFEFLYEFAVKDDVILYITSHSHIAINAFFEKEDTSIYHVIKENGKAEIKHIETHIDKTAILDDLDVKASDILQSNGIIWVEGPSDRIYIKRWLEVFTENKLKEGKDYQFLYYGGRLLSQYSAQEETELISIITTNRNAAIVIDSDKTNAQKPLNDTKKRVINEFKEKKMFSWVTKGKEIENYLSKESLESKLEVKLDDECKQYDKFPDYIIRYYKNFNQRKVPFANEMKEHITLENSSKVLDLKKQIEQLYKHMEKWS